MPSDGRLHGYLVIDKPAGWTSHDVVARLRRLLGERHVGHGGTLDPAATGVLPVGVGQATKTLEYLSGASKSYVAEITFGVETDSHDIDGRVVAISDPGSVTKDSLAAHLARMLGWQQQRPPMHSAVKIGGKRLYEAARRGEEIERPTRTIEISALELLAWTPPTATVAIDCSKGTYVRSIAADLGRLLGVGAYLSNLVRTRTGPFYLEDAWTLPELTEIWEPDAAAVLWPSLALHPDSPIQDWPAVILGPASGTDWQNGKRIEIEPESGTEVAGLALRAYDADGRWIGVGQVGEDRRLRPAKVVPLA